jgi:hypothetical protein
MLWGQDGLSPAFLAQQNKVWLHKRLPARQRLDQANMYLPAPTALAQAFHVALTHHQAGNFQQAEQLCPKSFTWIRGMSMPYIF